jgi:Leucine-rich repeat (LRR) protein
VSDAGLPDLVAFPQLTALNLESSRVSSKGLATLKAAFPHAQLSWSEPNRTAAEAVVALGGTIHIRRKGEAEDRLVKTAAELPADYFQVTRARLAGVQKPLGDLLPKLTALTDPDFDRLRVLDLSGTAADDGNLNALRPLTGLTELSLAGTKISDAGLADLQGLKHLRRLVLDGSAVRGTGLAGLKDLPALTDLGLGCPTLTDVFLNQLGELKRLERLSLAGSRVTDEGLKALHGLTSLQELDLTGTQVTAAGIGALQKALPKCRVLTK